MTKLVVENLHLSYDAHPILNGVSFQLKAGEVVSLLGASGSGKTTLLRAVAGLEQPSDGKILLDGKLLYDGASAHNLPVEQRALGLVFQSYALWPHRSVFDNVAYGLKLRRVGTAEIRQRVDQVLTQLGLAQLAGRFPFQLSGGQQQRVAIARALVYNPPVILLDEPLSNLDAKLREEARAWLRALIIELGLSALCVTHDQTEAMAMSDRILLLKNGRIEQEGTPAELYATPKSLYSAEFMGSNNKLTARVVAVDGHRVRIAGADWELAGQAIDHVTVGAGAQAVIRLERVSVADGPGENRVRARLVTAMYLGDRWEYLFDRGDLRFRAFGHTPREAGEYWVEFPANDCWVFAAA
ncbi:iron(III) transport system ATP-binding protein [Microvirgula sp. AG722]|uniref:ABC transporter ATP-binding protein n=1 Tax=Microvirgula sp. AG722 TaxID=2183901 RepID=UPI000DC3E845|nr:ABC transporter ATP-binding protein [Microvirgula sp. AG722]RAS19704.1 iron(III) transport system ATP-binding protein [Microvirgula sp. AG722]